MSERPLEQNHGQGVAEYLLILALVVFVGATLWSRFGGAARAGVASIATSLTEEQRRDCRQSDEYIFDPRAQRYRNKRTGRFTKGCP